MDSYSIIIKPHVTEKTMNLIDENNEITFVVRRSANKKQIKRAFEELYEEQVARVNTHITPKGEKVAYIKLVEEEMAEELAVRIGVF
ncbi:50S ribosomal protein L23 [Methanobrevibacter millerae]|uniref:Large ribosomal subunit protein uL23 n=1 Tax=Methanobrevibacter millerae TaxID=230361 RepID=A0A8T3VM26_9EURY|nr:50S ribosomal protein L23 [Methanobrevibacter millerae]MBE6506263.1 50S ribosomal protein L23 [Methanobrevibacter millerae]MBR0370644.1 50S ribosomal protein L23 [Methanobrevibacter sp.]